MTTITAADTPLVQYTLRLADDALVLGHRLSEWSGHAPMLEEDIALSNLGARPHRPGAARSMPTPARSRARAATRTRSPTCATSSDYRNVLLVEQPNGDFAATMVRQLLYAAFMHPYFRRCSARSDARSRRSPPRP